MSPEAPFAGMGRQIVPVKLTEFPALGEFIKAEKFGNSGWVQDLLLRNYGQKPPEKLAPAAKKAAPARSEEIKFDNIYIRSIDICNFRAIRELKIVLNDSAKTTQPVDEEPLDADAESPSYSRKMASWKMLLGVNGSGKSSFLKAVALALMGEDYYNDHYEELRLEPETNIQ